MGTKRKTKIATNRWRRPGMVQQIGKAQQKTDKYRNQKKDVITLRKNKNKKLRSEKNGNKNKNENSY